MTTARLNATRRATARKRCSKCGEWKTLAEFHRNRTTPDGLTFACADCNRERALEYRRTNLEEVRAKDRARALAAPVEDRRAKHKRWRDSNREHVREYTREKMREYYRRDPEKYRERRRKEYAANPERSLRASRKWREANAEKVREYSARYREENLESARERVRQYHSRPESRRAANERQQRERKSLGDHYVKRVLFPEGVPPDVPGTLIDAKRVQLQITRLLRERTK